MIAEARRLSTALAEMRHTLRTLNTLCQSIGQLQGRIESEIDAHRALTKKIDHDIDMTTNFLDDEVRQTAVTELRRKRTQHSVDSHEERIVVLHRIRVFMMTRQEKISEGIERLSRQERDFCKDAYDCVRPVSLEFEKKMREMVT